MTAPPQFELLDESSDDDARAFTWRLQILAPDGGLTTHALRLAWADYDLWSGGAGSPAAVAEAALGLLMLRAPELAARDRIELAWVRRVDPAADAEIPQRLRLI
ncbi:MAG: hypothetical protein AB8G96_10910 [Phycisphaerales bacterium]